MTALESIGRGPGRAATSFRPPAFSLSLGSFLLAALLLLLAQGAALAQDLPPSGDSDKATEDEEGRPDEGQAPPLGGIVDKLIEGFAGEKGLHPELQAALRRKEKELMGRAVRMKEEKGRLLALRAEVEARYRTLEALRETLQQRVVHFNEAISRQKDERFTKLQKVISGMDADRAAAMLAEMEEDLVVGLLHSMPQRKLAKILEEMPAKIAARLGMRFATMRKAKEDRGTTRSKP